MSTTEPPSVSVKEEALLKKMNCKEADKKEEKITDHKKSTSSIEKAVKQSLSDNKKFLEAEMKSVKKLMLAEIKGLGSSLLEHLKGDAQQKGKFSFQCFPNV